MNDLVQAYFDFWNKKDLNSLGSLFTHDVMLTDWTASCSGKAAVLALNQNIFVCNPEAHISISDYAVSPSGKIMVEIIVYLSSSEQLRVVDIFSLKNSLIAKIVAYKN